MEDKSEMNLQMPNGLMAARCVYTWFMLASRRDRASGVIS